MIAAGKTLDEARAFAKLLSFKNPGKYVTLYSCFGIFAKLSDRLHVHEPSDSIVNHYWLNGMVKPFTSAQGLADQLATPTMS